MRRRTRRAASLIEIIVAIAVFSTVLGSLAVIMNAGYEQYWTASGSLEVQKAALVGTTLLVKELNLSSMDSIFVDDPNPGPGTPVFDTIIFAQPEDLNGIRHYNSRGILEWHSYVAYYTEDVEGVRSLIRKQAANPSPSIDVQDPIGLGLDPPFMQGAPGPRMMLKGVSNFDIHRKEDLVKVELTGFFEQRGTFSITVRNQAFPKN